MFEHVYILTWSYDWNEGFKLCWTKMEMMRFIATEFDVDPDSDTFWDDVKEAYENDKWKSFQILKLNLLTMELIAITPDHPS